MMRSDLNRAITQMISLCPDAHIIQAELKRLQAEADKRVFCKECTHWMFMESEFGDCNNPRFQIPCVPAPMTKADDFCSYGERKEDG